MNAMVKLISLQTWAGQVYGDDAPCNNTLRRWAREGLIVPRPRKQGRAYFVEPHATYASPEDVARGRTNLMERIRHEPTTAKRA